MDGFDLGDEDLKFANSVGSTNTSTRFSYGRAFGGQNGGVGNVNITASDTVTVGVAARIGDDRGVIYFYGDGGTTQHVSIVLETDGSVTARRGSTSGTILGSVAAGTLGIGWHYIEAQVKVNDSTGIAKVRFDGSTTNSINFSGDTKNAGTNSTIDQVRVGVSGAGTNMNFDDLYVLNSLGSTNNNFLGDVRVYTLMPNANGDRSEMTGSDGNSTDNYLLVDEVPYSTADYVDGDVAAEGDLYNIQSLGSTPATIFAVQNTVIAAKDDAGARSIKPIIKIGGTTYNGATTALSTAYDSYMTIYETNPNSGVAWTNANVDSLQIGAETV
jgi:hypothetical protein